MIQRTKALTRYFYRDRTASESSVFSLAFSTVSVGKPNGKRSLRRHRHRREDNTRMNLRQTQCNGVDWIHLAQKRDQ